MDKIIFYDFMYLQVYLKKKGYLYEKIMRVFFVKIMSKIDGGLDFQFSRGYLIKSPLYWCGVTLYFDNWNQLVFMFLFFERLI